MNKVWMTIKGDGVDGFLPPDRSRAASQQTPKIPPGHPDPISTDTGTTAGDNG